MADTVLEFFELLRMKVLLQYHIGRLFQNRNVNAAEERLQCVAALRLSDRQTLFRQDFWMMALVGWLPVPRGVGDKKEAKTRKKTGNRRKLK